MRKRKTYLFLANFNRTVASKTDHINENRTQIFEISLEDESKRLGFKNGICLLIAPVPVHCFSIIFVDF